MELSAYLNPLRRWWWLLVAATLIAGVSSYIATLNQPPIYRARTTLMIGRVIDDPNPNQGEINLAQALAQTYADITNREPVRNATMEALDLNSLPEYNARALPQTQLIEISVTDVNPMRAQVVANELANQLILRSPTASGSEDQERQQFINDQLTLLQTQIEQTQEEINKLQEQLGNLKSARQLQDTQTQIGALQAKMNTLQGNYAALLSNTQQGATNTLTVVEAAELPSSPIGPRKSLSILLSAAIGFSLAAGAAYLLEYLDDTLKTPDEITHTLDLPVLGLIGETENNEDGRKREAYVIKHPRSPVAEAFRSLGANLEFAGVDKPLKTILIVSSDPSEGKSSIAANLAVVMAQKEKKVVLVDADLRRPSIHRYTDLSKESGLSDLFRSETDLFGTLKYWPEGNFRVITGGESPPNPAELLGSSKMDVILTALRERADVVIVDSPPFIVSDALMLASKVDGVLMVVRPGHTRKKIVKSSMQQLNRVGAKVVGVVMNRIPQRRAEYYGGYQYYSPYYSNGYYSGEEDEEAQRHSKRKKDWWRPDIDIVGLVKSINLKQMGVKVQEIIGSALFFRRESPEYSSVQVGEGDQDVPDVGENSD